ncbi:peroxisome membrane anchor protein Pex14p [Blakeslea trispora]|nr:peroxisome membrane anchor protein Pex14p [Blakeslea trispora]
MSNRQDLIKSAVSFLSSPNVQSADREKKVAFLQKKGLTQEEIDEAFQVVKGNNNTVNNNTVNNNTVNNNTANNNTANNNSKPLLPSRTQYPTIMYYPPTPSMPAEKVFALAVIVGMGAVGLTASVIGILRVK